MRGTVRVQGEGGPGGRGQRYDRPRLRCGHTKNSSGARAQGAVDTFGLLRGEKEGGHVDAVAEDDVELLSGRRRERLRAMEEVSVTDTNKRANSGGAPSGAAATQRRRGGSHIGEPSTSARRIAGLGGQWLGGWHGGRAVSVGGQL